MIFLYHLHTNQATLGLAGVWKGDLQCKHMLLKLGSVEVSRVPTKGVLHLKTEIDKKLTKDRNTVI